MDFSLRERETETEKERQRQRQRQRDRDRETETERHTQRGRELIRLNFKQDLEMTPKIWG